MYCAVSHDQFDRISKGGVEQPSQSLTKLDRQLLGSEAQERGQWYDGEEVEDENGDRIPPQRSSDDSERHEDKENIDIVAC